MSLYTTNKWVKLPLTWQSPTKGIQFVETALFSSLIEMQRRRRRVSRGGEGEGESPRVSSQHKKTATRTTVTCEIIKSNDVADQLLLRTLNITQLPYCRSYWQKSEDGCLCEHFVWVGDRQRE